MCAIASSAIAVRQVPSRLTDIRVDLRGLTAEVGLPLTGVTAHEAIEIFKAHAVGPLVERPGLARLEGRGVVILAKSRRRVAVILQNPPDGRLGTGDDRVITRVASRLLGNHTKPY